jgi:hypothetical protein
VTILPQTAIERGGHHRQSGDHRADIRLPADLDDLARQNFLACGCRATDAHGSYSAVGTAKAPPRIEGVVPRGGRLTEVAAHESQESEFKPYTQCAGIGDDVLESARAEDRTLDETLKIF